MESTGMDLPITIETIVRIGPFAMKFSAANVLVQIAHLLSVGGDFIAPKKAK